MPQLSFLRRAVSDLLFESVAAVLQTSDARAHFIVYRPRDSIESGDWSIGSSPPKFSSGAPEGRASEEAQQRDSDLIGFWEPEDSLRVLGRLLGDTFQRKLQEAG